MSAKRPLRLLAAAAAMLVAGCSEHDRVTYGTRPAGLPAQSELAAVPLGDVAGEAPNVAATRISNPYRGDASAAQAGYRLFVQMNCVGCHGYKAGGGMGPDLTDGYWRYGGAPAQIYNSIRDGRPKGMPAWGKVMASEDIWRVVTYIQSLGGAVPPPFADQALQGNPYGDPKALSSLKGLQGDDQP